MKKYLFLIVFSLFACGKNQDFKVDISNTTIHWQGYVNQSTDYLQKFNNASTCVSGFGYQRSGYPYLIIVDDFFLCNGVHKFGCVNFNDNTIYMTYTEPFPDTQDAVKVLVLDIFKHESIHWITLKGDGAHNEPYFKQCETSLVSVPTPTNGGGLITIVTASVVSF